MSNHLHLFKTFSENLKMTFQKFHLSLNAGEVVISDELYLCPISLVGFMKDSLQKRELTIEHVPPESLGGKPLVLTSKEVNSKDGYTSDKKLLKFFESENFKVSKGVIDAKVSSDDHDFKGVTAEFTVSLNNGKPELLIRSSKKNLDVLDFKGMFKNWDGNQFKLTWQQQMELDEKALLKCAYLTAFRRVGYELIFDKGGFKNSTYGVLINYLNDQNPADDFPVIYKAEHAPLGSSLIGLVKSPAEFRSILVNLSFKLNDNLFKYAVFLPHPDCTDLKNLQNLKDEALTGKNIDFQIAEVTMDIFS